MGLLHSFLFTSGVIPGTGYLWSRGLIGLHVVSDSLISLSYREDRDLNASYDLGVNSYIQEPVNFDQFRETISTLALYWLSLNQQPPRQPLTSRIEKQA